MVGCFLDLGGIFVGWTLQGPEGTNGRVGIILKKRTPETGRVPAQYA